VDGDLRVLRYLKAAGSHKNVLGGHDIIDVHLISCVDADRMDIWMGESPPVGFFCCMSVMVLLCGMAVRSKAM
jgi:hypothetical protein